MSTQTQVFRSSLLILSMVIAGCAGTPTARYAGLSSAEKLQSNSGDNAHNQPWRTTGQIDWHKYSEVMVDPVVIYQGADNQFGDLSQADRQELADYLYQRCNEVLKTRFSPTQRPSSKALRVKLTLTGAETTTPVLGTFTKFDLAGGPYNIVQSIRGREGLMNGSVSYAVEIYQADNNQLLQAWVTKEYPNAMNVSASFGSLSAAKVGIDKGTEQLLSQLK
ncbi:DUF3313 domain-containing protein [Erwinia sorbitola]|uniref:DUF3313 family protein n=1 Tax=Erwinia sorbitola TaxID=2681984 RepID=A0A6I6EMH3_9GAMM|nr:DUF3313 domain-containing protein [Erwinia sorbitola]QGU87516.1 DUF3313 family protein [Erwinia sorbitola]